MALNKQNLGESPKVTSFKFSHNYRDFRVNSEGIFIMLRQISDRESEGFRLVASIGPDVEGSGSTGFKEHRMLGRSNLFYENPTTLFNAMFEGGSSSVLSYSPNQYGASQHSYIRLDSNNLQTSTSIFRLASSSENSYKTTFMTSGEKVLIKLDQVLVEQNIDNVVTGKISILRKIYDDKS